MAGAAVAAAGSPHSPRPATRTSAPVQGTAWVCGGGFTGSKIVWNMQGKTPKIPALTPDCAVCDDSYDFGEQAISYPTRPFASLLRPANIGGPGRIEASDDLNALIFPPDFLNDAKRDDKAPFSTDDWAPLTLHACTGEQVVIRIVHPGGRARQHAFVMNGLGNDGLFPGFGFPNSTLLGPVKSVSAWLHPPTVLARNGNGLREPVTGKVLWHDGPSVLMAGGI